MHHESIAALGERRSDVTLFKLFMLFAVISSTAFGGAAIPMMRRDLVNKRGWLTEREFLDIYAIAQVSPGAIPVSIAVLVGRRLGGAAGFWLCLIAETVPGFLVLMVIAVLSMNPHMTILRSALKGCAAAAVGMMLGNAVELTWPYRAKVADVALLLAVGAAVLVLHFSLALMFLIFIPLSMAVQRWVRAE
jgi:chromate transporter